MRLYILNPTPVVGLFWSRRIKQVSKSGSPVCRRTSIRIPFTRIGIWLQTGGAK